MWAGSDNQRDGGSDAASGEATHMDHIDHILVVDDHPIVVEQRVVDVQQKHDRVRLRHLDVSERFRGLAARLTTSPGRAIRPRR